MMMMMMMIDDDDDDADDADADADADAVADDADDDDDVVVAVVCVVCLCLCRWWWDEWIWSPKFIHKNRLIDWSVLFVSFLCAIVVFHPLEFPVVDPVFCDSYRNRR